MGDEQSTLKTTCASVGVSYDSLSVDVRERLELLARHGETVRDGRRIIRLSQAIFDHYRERKPGRAFSDIEERVVLVGGFFADIGKTGPPGASEPARRLIVEMFSVEGVRDDQQPVSAFLRTYFPDDADERRVLFSSLGLDVDMPMRAFWNLHATWTLEIAQDGGLPKEAVAAAATHHLLEDVNPNGIVGDDNRYSADFGQNVAFDRAEKLVILLDKYDALLRRSRRTHAEAVDWLRDFVGRHPRFGEDAEFTELLEDLGVVGREQDHLARPSLRPGVE